MNRLICRSILWFLSFFLLKAWFIHEISLYTSICGTHKLLTLIRGIYRGIVHAPKAALIMCDVLFSLLQMLECLKQSLHIECPWWGKHQWFKGFLGSILAYYRLRRTHGHSAVWASSVDLCLLCSLLKSNKSRAVTYSTCFFLMALHAAVSCSHYQPAMTGKWKV